MSIVSAFGSFSVDDIGAAKTFYTETLGLKLTDDKMGLQFELPGGGNLFVYDKPDHQPAVFTVLNLVVDDIDGAVDELTSKGVTFEHYDNIPDIPAKPDEKGIIRGKAAGMGPDIGWFKDPAGNVVAVMES
jgi:catechol 2,3-dioxygenase-like lactoylglutathione lyase family enzyme